MIRKAVSFGLFATMSLLLTFYMAAQIAHFQLGKDRYSLTATFDDAMNLQQGDPVRLAGVEVGQVSGVKAVKGKAQVRFEVDKDVALGDDSEVAVRWLNIIGQRELYLYPGTSASRLKSGDTMTHTRSVVDLGALLNQLGPLTQALDPARVNELVESLMEALQGNRDNIDSVVADLNTVLGTLAQRKDTISQLLTDYTTITGEVSKRDLQIQVMVENLATLSTTFAQNGQVLDDALVQLPKLTTGLQTVLGTRGEELGRIVDNLSVVTGTLHEHLGEFETSLVDFPKALEELFYATAQGQFAGVNVVCIAPNAPPCPHPVLTAAAVTGSGALTTPAAFQSLLLGGAS
jgi:phospholipid/cholesterol/gamma-HCH transport system substrate-binding protein